MPDSPVTTWFTIAAPTRMICIRSWYWRRNACSARLRLLGREHVRAVLLPPPLHLGAGQPLGRVDLEAGRPPPPATSWYQRVRAARRPPGRWWSRSMRSRSGVPVPSAKGGSPGFRQSRFVPILLVCAWSVAEARGRPRGPRGRARGRLHPLARQAGAAPASCRTRRASSTTRIPPSSSTAGTRYLSSGRPTTERCPFGRSPTTAPRLASSQTQWARSPRDVIAHPPRAGRPGGVPDLGAVRRRGSGRRFILYFAAAQRRGDHRREERPLHRPGVVDERNGPRTPT